jgi:hypothetical protein
VLPGRLFGELGNQPSDGRCRRWVLRIYGTRVPTVSGGASPVEKPFEQTVLQRFAVHFGLDDLLISTAAEVVG